MSYTNEKNKIKKFAPFFFFFLTREIGWRNSKKSRVSSPSFRSLKKMMNIHQFAAPKLYYWDNLLYTEPSEHLTSTQPPGRGVRRETSSEDRYPTCFNVPLRFYRSAAALSLRHADNVEDAQNRLPRIWRKHSRTSNSVARHPGFFFFFFHLRMRRKKKLGLARSRRRAKVTEKAK